MNKDEVTLQVNAKVISLLSDVNNEEIVDVLTVKANSIAQQNITENTLNSLETAFSKPNHTKSQNLEIIATVCCKLVLEELSEYFNSLIKVLKEHNPKKEDFYTQIANSIQPVLNNKMHLPKFKNNVISFPN